MSSKTAKENARKEALTNQFRNITGATPTIATKFMKKYNWKLDQAVDEFFSDPNAMASAPGGGKSAESTKKIGELFEKYKDDDGDEITVEGTMAFAQDLALDLEDATSLALFYMLKSPSMGSFQKKGWTEGFRSLDVDSLDGLRSALPGIRTQLQNDKAFFDSVYSYAFEFAKTPGQRSIPIDNAKAFWSMLLPVGQEGAALRHEGDSKEGWKPEYNDWWFEFLSEKGGKGVSKDTWTMFAEFIRTIDARFEAHDEESAWPSVIDDFVEYSKARLQGTT